jgi:hypothetical protein
MIVPAAPVAVPGDAPARMRPMIMINAKSAPPRFNGKLSPAVAPPGFGYNPDQIRKAYGLDQLPNGGAGQTIGIVDAFGAANVRADLDAFSAALGLPTASLVVAYSGGMPTSTDTGWAMETMLDVEWAHAIAPNANILLVITPTDQTADLLAGVDYAATHACSQVSMSWGGPEFASETSLDTHFNRAGVMFFASSGDDGQGQGWPCASTRVVSVGGTSLSLDGSGAVVSETAWSKSGGGRSSYVTEPAFQVASPSAHAICNGKRGGPDVAWDADPATGVVVYNSSDPSPGWFQIGGTSAGAPQWAAFLALINGQRRANGMSVLADANGSFYALASGSFRDIISGSNGQAAQVGYDLVTGLGSPHGATISGVLAPSPTPTPTPSPTPTPTYSNCTLTVGLGPASQGWIERALVDIAHPRLIGGSQSYLYDLDWFQLTANAYSAQADASTRIACGDVDGDGVDEIVVGTGPSGGGRVHVYKNTDATPTLMGTIQLTDWPEYVNSTDSRTFPACVDVNGDGRAEVVIGTGSKGGGWVQIFTYDPATSTFVPFTGTPSGNGYLRDDWTAYNGSGRAEVHPGGAWLQGHGAGKQEQLILGLGPSSQGWMQIWGWNGSKMVPYPIPTSPSGWLQVAWPGYDAATDASTWPVGGDVDGDGLEDVAVGLSDKGQGWLEVFSSVNGVPRSAFWKQVAWSSYVNSGQAGINPAVGDIDGDGKADIVMGLSAAGGGWLYVLRTGGGGWTGSWARPDWPAYTGSGNAPTYPALARQRPSGL